MPNFASSLKEEIARLARREIRTEIEGLRKAAAQARAEIVALKRRGAELEKATSRLARGAGPGTRSRAAAAPAKIRFSARILANLRRRLGLTAADLGALLKVSAQTVYNWEAEKSRPRARQLEAFAALRGVGRRQVKALLAEIAN